jgi:hypothetical protein
MPRFNDGRDTRTTPYHVYKVLGALTAP